ncbi:hypothetical protein ABFS82_01G112100 [Erythranthe guttata]
MQNDAVYISPSLPSLPRLLLLTHFFPLQRRPPSRSIHRRRFRGTPILSSLLNILILFRTKPAQIADFGRQMHPLYDHRAAALFDAPTAAAWFYARRSFNRCPPPTPAPPRRRLVRCSPSLQSMPPTNACSAAGRRRLVRYSAWFDARARFNQFPMSLPPTAANLVPLSNFTSTSILHQLHFTLFRAHLKPQFPPAGSPVPSSSQNCPHPTRFPLTPHPTRFVQRLSPGSICIKIFVVGVCCWSSL